MTLWYCLWYFTQITQIRCLFVKISVTIVIPINTTNPWHFGDESSSSPPHDPPEFVQKVAPEMMWDSWTFDEKPEVLGRWRWQRLKDALKLRKNITFVSCFHVSERPKIHTNKPTAPEQVKKINIYISQQHLARRSCWGYWAFLSCWVAASSSLFQASLHIPNIDALVKGQKRKLRGLVEKCCFDGFFWWFMEISSFLRKSRVVFNQPRWCQKSFNFQATYFLGIDFFGTMSPRSVLLPGRLDRGPGPPVPCHEQGLVLQIAEPLQILEGESGEQTAELSEVFFRSFLRDWSEKILVRKIWWKSDFWACIPTFLVLWLVVSVRLCQNDGRVGGQ